MELSDNDKMQIWGKNSPSEYITSTNDPAGSCLGVYCWWLLSLILTVVAVLADWGMMWIGVIGVIFVIPGLFVFLPLALLKWRHWKRAGDATCKMLTFPGVIGGSLAVEVHLPEGVVPDGGGMDAKLTSTASTYSAGTTKRVVLWSSSQHIGEFVDHGDGCLWVPVSFAIPPDCEPTQERTVDHPSIDWMLLLTGRVKKRWISYLFYVPVLATQDSDAILTESDLLRNP